MDFKKEMIALVNKNPLYQAMGIRIETAEEGIVTSRLEPTTEMCWPFPDQPHGGVLFTLMDTTMAWAAISGQEERGSCSTIHLDIQYVQPALGNSFFCQAEVIYQTRRTSFVSATIYDADDAVLAMGQGTYRILQPPLV